MLTGFSLDETRWISLPEDEGEKKTEFLLANIPVAKLDELKARSYDHLRRMQDGATSGADLNAVRAYNREVVRWGVRDHRNGEGGLAECKTERVEHDGRAVTVLAGETLEVYERTIVSLEPILAEGKEIGRRPVSLLERLASLVHEAQTLTVAERRGLRGAGVAGS